MTEKSKQDSATGSEAGAKPRKDTRGRRWFESKLPWQLSFDEYKRLVRKHYEGPAGAVLRLASIASLHEPLAARLLRRRQFDLAGCKQILDVGTGAGQVLGHLLRYADPDARIYCTDLAPLMLRRALNRLGSDRIHATACDLAYLPFADCTFDCITCGWVIEHLPDPVPGLTEMARVLRPDGKVLVMATENTLPGYITSRTWKCRTYSRAELRSYCERAGLLWYRQLWFTPLHRMLGLGGIVVELRKA